MDTLDLTTLLAGAGGAISQEGSWQDKLAGVAGETAASEQERRYLADLLGGVPDPTGRYGLDPSTVLEGLQLKQQIIESQPTPVQMSSVTLPTGEVVSVPTNEVADFQRKVWAEQYATPPSAIRTFQTYQEWDDETKKAFNKFSEGQRGESFEETMAKFLIKQREAFKQEQELEAKFELGTMDHLGDVKDRWSDPDLSAMYNTWSAKLRKLGKTVPNRVVFREQFFINEMAKDIEDQRDDVSDVRYERGPKGAGFYGTNEAGERILIQNFQRRT